MAEVIPMSMESPQQLAMSLEQSVDDDIQSMACVFMDKDGELKVAFNTMTPELMLLLVHALMQHATHFLGRICQTEKI